MLSNSNSNNSNNSNSNSNRWYFTYNLESINYSLDILFNI